MACAPCLLSSMGSMAPLGLSIFGIHNVLKCKKCNKTNCNCKNIKKSKRGKKSKKIMYQCSIQNRRKKKSQIGGRGRRKQNWERNEGYYGPIMKKNGKLNKDEICHYCYPSDYAKGARKFCKLHGKVWDQKKNACKKLNKNTRKKTRRKTRYKR